MLMPHEVQCHEVPNRVVQDCANAEMSGDVRPIAYNVMTQVNPTAYYISSEALA